MVKLERIVETNEVLEDERGLQEKLDAKTEQSFSELLDYELQFIENKGENQWKQ